MAKAQGQIIARGEKRWLVRVFLGRDARKRKLYIAKTVEGGKKDALKVLRGLLNERDKGRLVRPSTMSLETYLTQWLRDAVKPRARSSTAETYRQTLWTHVVPSIGQVPLGKLTPLHVQSIIAAMSERGLASKTILNAVVLLRSALRQAMRWRILPTNPAEDAQLPRRHKRELNVPTREELQRLLTEAHTDRLWPLWILLLTTGIRPGEALALAWGDFNWESGLLMVQRSLSRVKGKGWALTEPKTDRGRRAVTVPHSAVEALREHRARQLEERMRLGPYYHDQGFVFATETGEPFAWSCVHARHWKPMLRRAAMACTECGRQLVQDAQGKVQHAESERRRHPATPSRALLALRPYDLRHLHATLALAAGVPIRAISERLGHFDAGFTLATYAHTMPGTQEAAAVAVEKALFGSNGQ